MANQVTPQTPQSYLKLISIIHIAMFTGQLLFGIAVLSITPQKGIDVSNTKDVFLFVVPAMAIGCFALSAYLFKTNLNIAINKTTLEEKLMIYQSALITRFAPLEGLSLFGIVTYMQTGNLLFIIISGLTALYFLSLRPTKDKIENDLNLSYEDKILFDSQEQLR
jgi:hypothetical protein